MENYWNVETLQFDEEHLPLQDSEMHCVGLQNSDLKNQTQGIYNFKSLSQGFGSCKPQQQFSDWPKKGLNFKTFMQKKVKLLEGVDFCFYDHEILVNGFCYSYLVAQKVCMVV